MNINIECMSVACYSLLIVPIQVHDLSPHFNQETSNCKTRAVVPTTLCDTSYINVDKTGIM